MGQAPLKIRHLLHHTKDPLGPIGWIRHVAVLRLTTHQDDLGALFSLG
jgi:hypothetical protein